MWRRWLILVAALGLLAAVRRRGSSEGIASLEEAAADPPPRHRAASTDPEQAMLDFTHACETTGWTCPTRRWAPAVGPSASPSRGSRRGARRRRIELMQAANEACQLPTRGDGPGIRDARHVRDAGPHAAFSQCMRDQGIDYPDPEFTDDGAIALFGGPGEDGGGTTSTPPASRKPWRPARRSSAGPAGPSSSARPIALAGRRGRGRHGDHRRRRRRARPGGRRVAVPALIPFLARANGRLNPGEKLENTMTREPNTLRPLRLAVLAAAVDCCWPAVAARAH